MQNFTKVKLLGVSIGQPAPEISVGTIDGHPFKLSDLRGRLVLIDFWATWCAPCIGELPNVYKAYEKFSGDGFTVISISFDKDATTAEKFMTSRQIPWPQIWAEGADKGPLAQAYGVSGIPAIFLIGPDGKVIAKDLRGEKLYEAIATEIARRKGGY